MDMYEHRVQYYETDKMGITHHSNYIRWMEEARIDFLEKIGYSFAQLEASGIVSPVLSVDCKYRVSTTFSDLIRIRVSAEEFRGVILKLNYKMYRDDTLVCEGHTEHCFLDKEGHFIRLKRDYPEFHDLLVSLASRTSEE